MVIHRVILGAFVLPILLTGCERIGGISDDRELASCEAGQTRCMANIPQVCGEDLTWPEGGLRCAGEFQACSAGTCVKIDDIAAGSSHSCVLLSDKAVMCWGKNGWGELGDGTLEDRPTPGVVPGLTGVESLALGGSYDAGHTCAVLANGTAACWGQNATGQLGNGTTEFQTIPTAVGELTSVSRLAAGLYHTCALMRDGTVQCWGWNLQAQAGQEPTMYAIIVRPMMVGGLDKVSMIAAGLWHTCALLEDRTVKCWGGNGLGQTGQLTNSPDHEPKIIPGLAGVRHIAAGYDHTCAVLDSGAVTCWGANNCGELGDGTVCAPCNSPDAEVCGQANRVTVALPVGADVEAVALGAHHGCASPIPTFNRAACWGRNEFRQANGKDEPVTLLEPERIEFPGIRKVALGSYHSCALMLDGTVFCWGRNDSGQLGIRTKSLSEDISAVSW